MPNYNQELLSKCPQIGYQKNNLYIIENYNIVNKILTFIWRLIMIIDRYTKTVLTIIALSLVLITISIYIPTAEAISNLKHKRQTVKILSIVEDIQITVNHM